MTDSQQLSFEQSKPNYSNNLLFAEHYLENRVPELPEWDTLHEDALKALEKLRAKRDELQPHNLKEAQLEKQWIHWILEDILGHHFAVQTNLSYGDGKYGAPDMMFTTTAEQAHQLGKTMHTPETLKDAIAVGDAKAWGVNFDKSSKNTRSPAQQIDTYLRYSELPWGVLTDGRYWRLYERNSSKYNYYYEVDLESLLEQGDTNQFLYFYLFFRQEAFTTGWLEQVFKGSKEYAETLRDSLEEEVFKALEDIAQGFLDYKRNRYKKFPSAEELTEIYEQSLILLYRLLFIFYAESRGILPIRNENYRRRSLQKMAMDAEHLVNFPNRGGINDSGMYARLTDLFFSLDEGDEQYKIPAYNGKLFSEHEYPFLVEKIIGDQYLSRAIEKLARIDVQRGRRTERVYVDYQDLEVSHLGTIYEKLLEYELDIAKKPLKISGANQVYKEATANQTPDKNVGEVYLRTGNNQRKVTGSYYTPDYIVRFIVEKTLEPLLLEITQKYATQDENGNWIIANSEALRDEILALNVLDPATGSGHFVVDVVAYMGQWLHNLGLELPELADVEDDLSYWMRQVASACIYAIDINPLAVELAKLSIWLKTLAQDKPLSFLDHHIRVGNSLVGTNLSELEALAAQPKPKKRQKKVSEKQAPLFGEEAFTLSVQSSVGQMAEIEAVQVHDVKDVKRQEAMYADFQAKLKPYEQLATVWTARQFGLDIMEEGEWELLYKQVLAGDINYRMSVIIDEAQKIADRPDMRFFHWDVAFPEIFFDEAGQALDNPGFDAVIGNPPYVRMEKIIPIKPFLSTHYDVHESRADLYLYFYERAINLLKSGKRLGYITSGTYMNTNSANPFRQFIRDNAGFEWVANFGENQPFKEAEMVFPTIMVAYRGKAQETFKNYFMDGNISYADMGDTFETAEWVDGLSEVIEMNEWRFQARELTQLFTQITTEHQTLSEAIPEGIFRGIVTGYNEAFIIDAATRQKLINEHPSSEEIIKPMLSGQDLRPWYQLDNKQYIIFAKHGVDIDKYPAIYKFLLQHKEKLEQRATINSHKWYELQQPQMGIYQRFEQPKIFWSEISKLPRFSIDKDGWYSNNKCYFIASDKMWLLGILQSRVAWFFLSQISTPLRLRAGLWQYQLYIQFVERLPIPELKPEQERELAEIAETITAQAKERYQLHENVRQTISADFGGGQEIGTRLDLYQWWQFADADALNADLSGRSAWSEIPLNKRSDWRTYFTDEKAKHQAFTDKIIAEETRMNSIVYDAFGLDATERQLIEEATKYPYGEV